MTPPVTDRPAIVNSSVRRRTDFGVQFADASCRVPYLSNAVNED